MMLFLKRIFAINCILLICVSIASEPLSKKNPSLVHWIDYNTALNQAKENPKLIFVDFYADWCVPCRIMDKNVYGNPTVANLLNTKFYPVKLNSESNDIITCDGQKKTVKRCYFDVWELYALPAFVLVAPKGLSILTVTDSMNSEEMLHLLNTFLEKEMEWIKR